MDATFSSTHQNSNESALALAKQALKELQEVTDQLNKLDESFDAALLNQATAGLKRLGKRALELGQLTGSKSAECAPLLAELGNGMKQAIARAKQQQARAPPATPSRPPAPTRALSPPATPSGSDGPADEWRAGWVLKLGRVRGWKRRWLVLGATGWVTWADEAQRVRGRLQLQADSRAQLPGSAVTAPPAPSAPFDLRVAGRVLPLAAPSVAERDAWLRAVAALLARLFPETHVRPPVLLEPASELALLRHQLAAARAAEAAAAADAAAAAARAASLEHQLATALTRSLAPPLPTLSASSGSTDELPRLRTLVGHLQAQLQRADAESRLGARRALQAQQEAEREAAETRARLREAELRLQYYEDACGLPDREKTALLQAYLKHSAATSELRDQLEFVRDAYLRAVLLVHKLLSPRPVTLQAEELLEYVRQRDLPPRQWAEFVAECVARGALPEELRAI